ncbi:MAG: nicotinate-nucleotide adenylyltransferase [Gammaproteobacteria bacterium]|nr:nicotinate-nucleotide adenylyltransferase [Gammaproteobacteria bacterium]
MKTIGILGGTFDPVHQGHISLAQQAQKSLKLEQIQFLPCSIPVHRNQPLASAEDRLHMLEQAIAGRKNWQVNTVELDRDGPSYMVDSLRLVRDVQGHDSLILLLGVDAFNAFYSWKSPEEILTLSHLVVCRRPGVEVDKSIFASQQTNDPDLLHSRAGGYILFLDINENHCSSSGVRQALLRKQSIADCLSPTVAEYIKQHQLYEVNSE